MNKYSGDSLTTALAIGKDLDYALRHGQIQLTQQSFDKKRINLSLDKAKVFVAMATHKSYCEKGHVTATGDVTARAKANKRSSMRSGDST